MNPQDCSLSILDVGHGNAALLREGSVSVLIDAAVGSHVLEFLQRQDIRSLSVVVLSHSDQDHIGGLIGLLAAGIDLQKVILNTDSEKQSELWRDLVFCLEDARRRGEIEFRVGLTTGELIVEKLAQYRLQIVSPNPDLAALGPGALDRQGRKITSNTISACLRLHFQGKPIALLTGDLDQIALDEVEAAGTDAIASLLVFPHHGGLPGSADAVRFTCQLLAKVRPTTVVFSNGRGKHDNPRSEVVQATRSMVKDVHLACTQLSAVCSEKLIERKTLQTSKFFSAGATRNACCAGTIAVDLATGSISKEQLETHIDFVRTAVTKPLCKVPGV